MNISDLLKRQSKSKTKCVYDVRWSHMRTNPMTKIPKTRFLLDVCVIQCNSVHTGIDYYVSHGPFLRCLAQFKRGVKKTLSSAVSQSHGALR